MAKKDDLKPETQDFYPAPQIIQVTLLLVGVGLVLLEFGQGEAALAFGAAIVYLGGFAALSLVGGYLIYFIQARAKAGNRLILMSHLLLGFLLLLINLILLGMYLSEFNQDTP